MNTEKIIIDARYIDGFWQVTSRMPVMCYTVHDVMNEFFKDNDQLRITIERVGEMHEV